MTEEFTHASFGEGALSWDDVRTGSLSATIELGMTFPIGAYERLHTPIDGVGSAAAVVKERLLFDALFDTWGNHAMRLRLYGAAYEPVAHAPAHRVVRCSAAVRDRT